MGSQSVKGVVSSYMSDFLVWLKVHIAQWWQFLCASKIPSTEISYAALILSLVAFHLFLFVVRTVLFHTHPDLYGAIESSKRSP